MIKEGSLCIWQNVLPPYSYINGQECTVVRGLSYVSAVNANGYRNFGLYYVTDTPSVVSDERRMAAKPHQLRLKSTPPEDKEEVGATSLKEAVLGKGSAMIFLAGLFLGACVGVIATSLVYINKVY